MIWYIISPPRHGEGCTILCCNLRDFPDKVINNSDFLHLLAVHLLDLADQDFTDKPVQYGLVQFLNGGIAPDFLDKGADFTFLRIGTTSSGSFRSGM